MHLVWCLSTSFFYASFPCQHNALTIYLHIMLINSLKWRAIMTRAPRSKQKSPLTYSLSCGHKQRRVIALLRSNKQREVSPLWAGPSASRGRLAGRQAPPCCWCRPVGAESEGGRASDTRRSCCPRTCHNLEAEAEKSSVVCILYSEGSERHNMHVCATMFPIWPILKTVQ